MNKLTPASVWQFRTPRFRRGVALIVTLAASVLLTVLLLAFFSLAILNRQISFSSMNIVKTDSLTRSAMDEIIGEFREEIRGHSTPTTIGGLTIYTPLASTNAIPIRDAGLVAEKNLLRISTETPPADSYALGSSSVLSSSPSANNRFLSGSRWEKIALRTGAISADTTPRWILVTRSGPKSLVSLADAGNKNSDNYVIGRYAYAIYDEGSLLDINVAGYPDAAAAGSGKKGPASFADLSGAALTGLNNLWSNWRNPSVTTEEGYLNEVMNVQAPNGFRKISTAANTFLSRRDAISFAKANSLSAALPYLGTSLFEKNSPVIPPGTDPSLNPDFTKLISPVTRKPLQRFPLSRFKLLDHDPASLSVQEVADILKYFGLKTGAGASNTNRAWEYRASTIGTLDAAIAAGRDPDLFELLKAAITNGSLGAFCANTPGPIKDTTGGVYTPETNVQHQVARIIANLIDQSDGDNYPTTITMGSNPMANTVHGIEHLPYFSEMFVKVYYPSVDISINTGAQGHIYFELWDPHQGSAPVIGPTQVRIIPTTDSEFRLDFKRIYSSPFFTTTAIITPWTSILAADSTNSSMGIGALAQYSSPLIVPGVAGDPSRRSGMTFGASAYDFNSFSFGSSLTSTVIPRIPAMPHGTFYDPAMLTWGDGDPFQPTRSLDGFFIHMHFRKTNFLLQYQDAGGNWRTYSTFSGHENDAGVTGIQSFALLRDSINSMTFPFNRFFNNRIDRPNASMAKPDPRTFRFRAGMSTAQGIFSAALLESSPYFSPNAAMVSGTGNGQQVDPLTYPGYPSAFPGMSYQNRGGFELPDPDGTVRVADGYLDPAANPMVTGATTSRPLILNRPFRSLGELGYVFRDVPWKSLNLFSSDSGDAALLELFSIEEGDIVAGKTNLNTPHKEIVTALLQGALRDELDSTSGMGAADADHIAGDLVTSTTASPILNRADLVRQFTAYNGSATSAAFPAIKTRREATVRALASATQTRTWNLLIDLVAQSGRYTPSASGLEKFTVEGERHCWMHVAIDRYTGEILRTQLEVVDE